jgi:magnesium-transporting ATPase (P-type)
VWRDGEVQEILAKNLAPGMLIRAVRDEKFSCDAIVVAGSFGDDACFVDTAELDGYFYFLISSETNLKRRVGVDGINISDVQGFQGEIQSEAPNENLGSYEGRLVVGGTVYPVGINNLLLRGAVLRNTEYCWGVVLYTGANTKV